MIQFPTSQRQRSVRTALAGLVLLSGLILSSTAHALGDGKAISGPDLEGVSIPPEADRTFTEQELNTINHKCTYNAMKSFVDQLFGTTYEQMKVKPEYRRSEEFLRSEEFSENTVNDLFKVYGYRKPGDSYGPDYRGYDYCYSRAVEFYIPEQNENRVLLKVRPPSPTFTPACAQLPYQRPSELDQIRLNARVANNVLPRLSWSKEESDLQYDEYGRLVSSRWVLQNIRIANADQTPWQFGNSRTGQPTKIVFDPRKITACLRAELLSGQGSK